MKDNAQSKITKHLGGLTNLPKIFLALAVVAILAGTGTGYVLAQKSGGISADETALPGTEEKAKVTSQDTKTFRDFAEGTIRPKETGDDYSEGTHILERANENPVTLTSSVVDLSKYEGKKVKVSGETQKALKSGWLMDVGKVEEL